MMEKKNLGSPLFRRNFVVSKHVEHLLDKVDEAARVARAQLSNMTVGALRMLLESQFKLEPLQIGPLQSISIEVQERHYRNPDGFRESRHLAEAILSYAGSSVLWKQKLHHGFTFPYLGKIAKHTIKLTMMMDVKDFSWAENDVETNLAKLRAAMLDFSPTLEPFNNLIDRTIDDCVAKQQGLLPWTGR